ncbi:MAG: SAM-dependent chlorinase/fluorinase, partial [Desulfobacterales bacterium]|nr:SAM-dependent chlorinase/fluorinase [Desulfobacterales bacterium]
PGVGSERKAICIRTSDFYFIGPDNGVLWPAADANGIKEIRELNNPGFFLDSISHTFHGRDIFAPVAARLSGKGTDFSRLGPVMGACHTIGFPEPKKEMDYIELAVLYKDRFGNLTLNLRHDPFQQAVREGPWQMVLNGHPIEHLHLSYSRAEPGQLFLIPASSGFMEVSVKNADVAEYLGAEVGDRAKLYLKRGG